MFRRTLLAALAAVLASVPARAEEGMYFSQAFGVGMAKGQLQSTVGNAIHSRIAIGARVRFLAFEAFIQSAMQLEREGAFRGLAGGSPAEGLADLEAYGFAVRAIAPLYHAPAGERLEGYVRVGPAIYGGTGMLDNYRGYGFGTSAGVQLTGKVRALGFLWAPLFFMNKGPKVTGSLFLDQGFDFLRLARDDARTIRARVGQVSVGFAVGSSF